jgi:DNA-binding NtrC family response regulator
MAKILIIENDQRLLRLMAESLLDSCYDVEKTDGGQLSLDLLSRSSFDLIIIDSNLGAPQIHKIIEAATETCKIFLFISPAEESTQLKPEDLQEGVYHFLQYPFSVNEFMAKVKKALDQLWLSKEIDYLHHERKYIYNFDDIIGKSPKLKKIFEVLKKVAQSNTTVLITGETGTGKELIAGAIHFNSRRRKNSFIAVNCAALPETLLESELFGHEKGAFTGAHKNRIGRCEQADKGTLFLDEISEMAPMTQAKILRFLQNQELVRVGGTDTIKVDVQIIAATNKDLQHEVKEGRFREDLYYRLNVVHIPLPPLRERKEDIPLLAEFFLDRYRRTLNKKEISGFDDKAIKLLMEHDWPGNIRELENVVERAVLMGEDKVIHAEDILYIESQQGMSMGLHKDISLPPEGITLDEVEKNLILQALERTGWIQKDAAKLLGLSRRVIQYKIAKHNIKNPKWPKNR